MNVNTPAGNNEFSLFSTSTHGARNSVNIINNMDASNQIIKHKGLKTNVTCLLSFIMVFGLFDEMECIDNLYNRDNKKIVDTKRLVYFMVLIFN